MISKSFQATLRLLAIAVLLLASAQRLSSQATVSTGSIQGTILDPKGAVVASAKVTITNKDTGQRIEPVVSTADANLELGSTNIVVSVEGSAIAVNTEQATVQGVLTTQQIENLPLNGRNFLDLAQLEPGVQIQDGANFDPTKNGFSSISFGGRYGRATRIEVDGIDISDETVGTTTQNIPAGAIQEFQLGQSM